MRRFLPILWCMVNGCWLLWVLNPNLITQTSTVCGLDESSGIEIQTTVALARERRTLRNMRFEPFLPLLGMIEMSEEEGCIKAHKLLDYLEKAHLDLCNTEERNRWIHGEGCSIKSTDFHRCINYETLEKLAETHSNFATLYIHLSKVP